MTDEQFVHEWFDRNTGREFYRDHLQYAHMVRTRLAGGTLPTCDPSEGIAGPCSCGQGSGKDIRFYLDSPRLHFMSICPGCDSWAVYDTVKKQRMDRETY